jgi:polar amino acid transport system substrate-binding protein
MRVGVVENPPWSTFPRGGGAGGIEGALVAELARELGARVEWIRGSESPLLESLRLGELDVVIGGLTDDTPWTRRVALTKPFYTDTIVVGAPPGVPRLEKLDGQTVAVRAGDPTAAYVRKEGGVPLPMAEVAHATGFVAMPIWELHWLGYGPTGITLREVHHVIAAPPRDNAWLNRIEQTIRARKAAIPEILRTSRP